MYLSVYGQPGRRQFCSANKPANSAVIKNLSVPEQSWLLIKPLKFLMTLPLAGASAIRNQRTLGYFLSARLLPTWTSLMTLPHAGALAVWNKRSPGCFLTAKLSPTFGSFGSALNWSARLFATIFAFKDMFVLTVLHGNCQADWLLPHRPEAAPPRSVTATPSQLREALQLCMSSRRSSSLRSSSQQWVEATSS